MFFPRKIQFFISSDIFYVIFQPPKPFKGYLNASIIGHCPGAGNMILTNKAEYKCWKQGYWIIKTKLEKPTKSEETTISAKDCIKTFESLKMGLQKFEKVKDGKMRVIKPILKKLDIYIRPKPSQEVTKEYYFTLKETQKWQYFSYIIICVFDTFSNFSLHV